MQTRGLFITFEGGDGCGKSTQSKKAFEYLQSKGVKVIYTSEPRGTIRQIVKHSTVDIDPKSEFLLFSADRLDHVLSLIIPSIESGVSVLSDRYADSSRAYQGHGRGLDLGYVEQVTRIVTQGIEPNLTLLFDIDVEKALVRAKKSTGDRHDRLEHEKIEFHKKLRQGFLEIAKQNPKRIKVIDANGTVDEVFSRVVPYLNDLYGIK